MDSRISLLLVTLLAACSGGGGGGSGGGTPSGPVDATITIDNSAAAELAASPVNRRLLGSNLQWTDGGDGMLADGTLAFSSAPLDGAVALAPTVLRYPGGGHADQYRWANGIGALGSRGTSMHVFTGEMQTIRFGTDEFLSLCQQTGAAGMITVNIISGSAGESADWVRYVNGDPPTGADPVVADWEIGNEPYLQNSSHPEWDIDAATFAAAYDSHVAAMVAADPRIRVGLPILGGLAAPLLPTGRQTWNADVIGAISQRVDFVAIHNAYLPFYYTHASPLPDDAAMLRSTLASAPAVDADLDGIRAQLTSHGITAPFAMTEHNALMTVFGTFAPIPRSDGIPTSLAGAVYTADLLCLLAKRSDMDSAEHWSLISNWMFGALAPGGAARPAQRALTGLSGAFTGKVLPAAVDGPVADVPGLGALPAQTAMPLVGALATGGGGTVRVVLVNRSPDRAMRVRLACLGGVDRHALATVRTLNADDPLAEHYDGSSCPDWVQTQVATGGTGPVVDLPAHALVIATIPGPAAATAAGPLGDG